MHRAQPDDGLIEVLFLDMRVLSLRKGWVDSSNPQNMQTIYLFGPKAAYLFFVRGLYHLFSDGQSEFATEDNLPLSTLEDWDKKLESCYQLFNYAWATADDGCVIECCDRPHDHQSSQWKIKRYTAKSMSPIPDDHAASVWDLYPFRVTEIDDLGKMFAVVCASLRLYTSDDLSARQQEIDWLLDRLHREKDIADNPDCARALQGQKRYNGHLRQQLLQCRVEIQQTLSHAKRDVNAMKREKQRLLRAIFSWRT